MPGIRLIAGLGNPGKEYADTRHNVGFWWLDEVAAVRHVRFRSETKFHGRVGRDSAARELWLLQPQTYMNASGRAVAAFTRFYRIAPEALLVAHDDLDLPAGEARLKKGGGHGGHNGLRDIMAQLGTPDFWRLRFGIGRPGDRGAVVSHVLDRPRQEEEALIRGAMARALRILPLLEAGDFAAAMKQLHTKEKAPPGDA